jgi:flagellar biosynthesis/type III secretory pathway protein FliH
VIPESCTLNIHVLCDILVSKEIERQRQTENERGRRRERNEGKKKGRKGGREGGREGGRKEGRKEGDLFLIYRLECHLKDHSVMSTKIIKFCTDLLLLLSTKTLMNFKAWIESRIVNFRA